MHKSFADHFDAAPDGIWSAPGRVNLIGEHTDYNGGAALPFAIDRRTRVAVRLRDDRRVRAHSTRASTAIDTDLDAAIAPGWGAYVLGVARMLWQSDERGFDLLVDSDLPVGVGVSSSHALECATLVALCELWDRPLSAAEQIALTQRVEHEVVGALTGTLDQSAILLAQADHGVLLDFGTDTHQLVPLGFADAGLEVLVIDSTQRHSHASGDYGLRRAECEAAADFAGVQRLAEIPASDLPIWQERMPETLFRRTRHIVTDTARTHQLARLVRAGSTDQIGPILTAGHRSQRDDFENSTPAIDAAVASATAAGALGARMTGGGFGGACIALVRMGETDAVAEAVSAQVSAAGFPAPMIETVHPSDGAHRDD